MTVGKPPLPALKVPRQIWALGFVWLLMDVFSEMIQALLPIYLVSVLGVSFAEVGWIEGIAEATDSIVKVFSGAVSDWLRRPKLLAVVGYGLAALVKPIFPLAGGAGGIVAARFLDRVGKGIRGAPRDALVASISPPSLLGASIGLRQTLDTVGAFLSPLAAVALMWATSDLAMGGRHHSVTTDDIISFWWVASTGTSTNDNRAGLRQRLSIRPVPLGNDCAEAGPRVSSCRYRTD